MRVALTVLLVVAFKLLFLGLVYQLMVFLQSGFDVDVGLEGLLLN